MYINVANLRKSEFQKYPGVAWIDTGNVFDSVFWGYWVL